MGLPTIINYEFRILISTLILLNVCSGAEAQDTDVTDMLQLGQPQASDTSDGAFAEKEGDQAPVESTELKAQTGEPESRTNNLEKQISTEARADPETGGQEDSSDADAELSQDPGPYRSGMSISWFLVGIGLSLVIGFLAGYWWLDSQIRMRHGGFRVH